MDKLKAKHQYAKATLSGSLTKTEAFRRYVNPRHLNPTQGAYRLEQTKGMQELLTKFQEEQCLEEQKRADHTRLLSTSMNQINELLEDDTLSLKERLATLRLAAKLLGTQKSSAAGEVEDDQDSVGDTFTGIESPRPHQNYNFEGIIS